MASRRVSVYVRKNTALNGKTDSVCPTACSISTEALSSVALAESIKAAEGEAHPSLCIYETAHHDHFPAEQKHPHKSQVLQSHGAIMVFRCKIAPRRWAEAQKCHFF